MYSGLVLVLGVIALDKRISVWFLSSHVTLVRKLGASGSFRQLLLNPHRVFGAQPHERRTEQREVELPVISYITSLIRILYIQKQKAPL
jgi:hypothetical protein